MNLLSVKFKADQSDFLLPAGPVGNSVRLNTGMGGGVALDV